MRILNATTKTLSIILDNGELMTINPGQMSKLFIATKNIVLSAIKLGDPSQIGIVYGSVYELDIARTISVALPYLYASEKEATAKLLDEAIDYTKKVSETSQSDLELTNAKERIKELEAQIEVLNSTPKSDENYPELITELKSQISELQTKIGELNNELSDLEECKSQYEELSVSYKKLKDTELQLSTSNSTLTKDNEELRTGLETALSQIEAMKVDFNTACTKFGLSKRDGEWTMIE